MDSDDSGSQTDATGERGDPVELRDVEAREAVADDREADLDAREARAGADDSARNARRQRHQDILGDAEARDVDADARDTDADRRDRDESLASFLKVTDDRFGDNLKTRRSAALDRTHSKEDRSLAAADRDEMADVDQADDGST